MMNQLWICADQFVFNQLMKQGPNNFRTGLRSICPLKYIKMFLGKWQSNLDQKIVLKQLEQQQSAPTHHATQIKPCRKSCGPMTKQQSHLISIISWHNFNWTKNEFALQKLSKQMHILKQLVCRIPSLLRAVQWTRWLGFYCNTTLHRVPDNKPNTESCANLTCKYVSVIADTRHIALSCKPVWVGENKCEEFSVKSPLTWVVKCLLKIFMRKKNMQVCRNLQSFS